MRNFGSFLHGCAKSQHHSFFLIKKAPFGSPEIKQVRQGCFFVALLNI
jgi:hypothetical protein